MADLVFTPVFSPVVQVETTDLWLGGAGEIANAQAQALGERDEWVLDYLNGLEFKKIVSQSPTGIVPTTPADKGTVWQVTNASGAAPRVDLPPIATVDDNAVFGIASGWLGRVSTGGPFGIGIMAASGETIGGNYLATGRQQIDVYEGVLLVKKKPGATTEWTIIARIGSLPVGTIVIFPTVAADNSGHWRKCNGASVAIAGYYGELFTKIGYTFGGAGAFMTLPSISSGIVGCDYYIKATI